MAENPAGSADLIARSLRALSSEEIAWGTTKLDDAFDQIVGLRPSIETYLDGNPTDTRYKRLVVQVICAMVLRVLGNPDGKLEENGDDYSYRLDAAVSTGALYASDAELDLLTVGDSVSDGAFTIKPHGVRRTRAFDAEVGCW